MLLFFRYVQYVKNNGLHGSFVLKGSLESACIQFSCSFVTSLRYRSHSRCRFQDVHASLYTDFAWSLHLILVSDWIACSQHAVTAYYMREPDILSLNRLKLKLHTSILWCCVQFYLLVYLTAVLMFMTH